MLLDLLRWMGEGDKMVLLTDSWERPVFRNAILDAAVEEGRLSVQPSRSIMRASGRFDPEAFLRSLIQEVTLSSEEGHTHTVLVWEADWAASSEEDSRSVAEFGAHLSLARLPGAPTIVVQYGTRAFSPRQTEMHRRSNQLVLEASSLARNFWVVSTQSFDRRMSARMTEVAGNIGQSGR